MNQPKPLQPGLRHTERMVVTPAHTVPQVGGWPGFADMPPVFATAMMIGFMEQTCIQALRPYLAPGQHTVGTQVDMNHVAATPVGMAVQAEVELVAVEGQSLTFKVTCSDDAGLIGEGTHRRAIIDPRRFEERLAAKAAAHSGASGI
ncbi:thioesterase family protein [Comamonas badia]|uniref:thioesterase family protein n=1 Tax=Comamonas badia TaxID=265291 RepID=UPI000409E660|nr:thioesterase family protein [Comamonas badia]